MCFNSSWTDEDADVDQRLEQAVLSDHCRRICSTNAELGRQAESLNNRLSVIIIIIIIILYIIQCITLLINF